jgi:DNA-binding transcriptional LysR family regulator
LRDKGHELLTLRQLETFRQVVRTRTTVGAARALRVSQPAVSNAIRQMESQIGFALFERVGNRLVPTPDAQEIFRDSEAIFSLYEAFSHRIESHKRSAAGTLRLVGTPPLANALIPGALKEFLRDRPAVRVSVDTRRIDGVLESVETRMADIGFALNPPERTGLIRERIATAQMICAFPPGHPLEDRVAVTPQDLEKYPLVLFEPASRLNLLLQNNFLTDRMRANAVAEVRYSSLACQLAEAGLGVTIVDSLTGIAGARYRLSFRPLYPTQPVPICVITRATEAPRRVQEAFLKELYKSEALAALEEFHIPQGAD